MAKTAESKLLIYQKYVDVIDYGYNLLIKYPKTEKYALTSEIRKSMFETIRLILYANKISNKMNKLNVINKIDAEISTQKYFVRFSYKKKYINSSNYYEWSKKIRRNRKNNRRLDKIMPKRVNNIFKPVITFNKILEAHSAQRGQSLKCKMHKRDTP